MTRFERNVYTLLDWMSDVGGLNGAIYAVVAGIFMIIKAKEIDWYLVSKLYTRR